MQKSALRIILRDRYINYKNALNVTGLETLEVRRQKLCLKFAKACISNDKFSDMFPRTKKDHSMEKRKKEVFLVKRAKTARLRKSAIVNMQKMLNKDLSEKRDTLKKISTYMPVNYDCMQSLSL